MSDGIHTKELVLSIHLGIKVLFFGNIACFLLLWIY